MPSAEDFIKFQTEIAAHDKINLEAGFNAWLQEPLVKALVSMIPPGPSEGVLTAVLRSAFDTGYKIGATAMTHELLNMVAAQIKSK